jgi:hypothetical protein
MKDTTISRIATETGDPPRKRASAEPFMLELRRSSQS